MVGFSVIIILANIFEFFYLSNEKILYGKSAFCHLFGALAGLLLSIKIFKSDSFKFKSIENIAITIYTIIFVCLVSYYIYEFIILYDKNNSLNSRNSIENIHLNKTKNSTIF